MWWTPIIITMAQWRDFPSGSRMGGIKTWGAAENLDYDYLLMGTSVTANFT